MPDNLQRFLNLKNDVEMAQQKADKATGALEQLLTKLKEDFDCDSLREAKTLLKKLKHEEKSSGKKFEAAMQKFEDEWGNGDDIE